MAEARLIGAGEAVRAHGERWRELAIERENAFITPEWFEVWSRHYGADSELSVAAVSDPTGELLGLIPFAVARAGFPRVARLAGSSLADSVGPIATAASEAEVAAAAIRAVSAGPARWGALIFENVDSEAAWHRGALTDARGRALRARRRSQTVLPYANLAPTYDEYLAGRSGSFRRQLRRFDRRLEKEAAIVLRQTQDLDELDADLETFFALHFGRWAERGGSTLDSDRIRAFHRDFSRVALERGWLRLFLLEADGTAVAAFYGWRLGDRYAFYQGGFDPEWSRLSVGLVLHGRVIQQAIEEGARAYDMLLGDEAYKFRFCDAQREAETVMLARPGSAASLIAGADAAGRSLVRKLPDDARERVRGALGRFESKLPTGRKR